MSPVEIDYVGEGASDDAAARKIIHAVAAVPGTSYRRPLSGTGKDSLDRRLKGLDAGSAYGNPVLVLRDLDHDASCPPELIRHLMPRRHKNFFLRVCVRELETWLLADVKAYASFSGMSVSLIPKNLEALDDPKKMIVGWAEKGAARELRRHLVEGRKRGVADWSLLGAWHAEFAEKHWDPNRAATSGRVPSLARTLQGLRDFVAAA